MAISAAAKWAITPSEGAGSNSSELSEGEKTEKEYKADLKAKGIKADRVTGRDASEIKHILKSDAFKETAAPMIQESVNCSCEPGAIRAYALDSPSGESGAYLIEALDVVVLSDTKMLVPAVNSKLRHVFDWHPHPTTGARFPSASDISTSISQGAAGVISYPTGVGNRRRDVIFQGKKR